jgi:hypothetical protein
MGKRKTLSYAQHLELGARIKAARKLLQDIHVRVHNGLGATSKASKIASRVFYLFDSDLRNELDVVIFRDHFERTDKELRRMYYGPTRNDRVVLHQPRKSD